MTSPLADLLLQLERARESSPNARVAKVAIENAMLAAKSGDVRWSYVEHELTTARLRWSSFTRHDEVSREVRALFDQGEGT